MAWEGFDWNIWKETTGVRKPDVHSPQSGHETLLPLLASEGVDSTRIETIAEWEKKRNRILSVLETMMGAPTDPKEIPPYAEILGEVDTGSYIRRHLRIATEPDDWIPAYLLLPKNLPDRPSPGMIVLHQTQAPGKEEPCGLTGNPEMAFAAELVKRGMICLVPDVIGFGERIPKGADPYHGAMDFYRKHPDWSFFGKMIWDFRQVVDFLETLPEVDPYRIGSIGHSHGAYGTIICSIFEPRIAAAVASCGFNTLRTDPSPSRWSHLTALLPRLGFYVDDIKQAPFDWHEVIACMAPRPFFYWGALNDEVFPNTENLACIYDQVKQVYGLYGAAEDFVGHLVPGRHSFSKEGREEAYRWLEQVLPSRPYKRRNIRQIPRSVRKWEKERDLIRTTILRDIGSVEPPAGLSPEIRVLQSVHRDGYSEKKIVYPVAPEESVPAYLLVPDATEEPLPGIVVFHQTTEHGKDEVAGHAGKKSLFFGPELARRGYVVLIPDSICAGERVTESGAFNTKDFYLEHPNLSALGKMIRDGRRAIDVLQSLSETDPDRIGLFGHSLGAEEALFVAAFDPRVQVAAASCGYAPFAMEGNVERWSRDHWFSYMPRLRAEMRAGRLPAWDFDDVIRLIAPRGYFNYQTRGDAIFPEGYSAHALTLAARTVWRIYGKEDRLRSLLDDGPHDVSPAGKQAIYGFLDSILKNGNGKE